jgi:FtsH-binding integral membrane protein
MSKMMQPNDEDRASTAVRVWMPMAAVAVAIAFVIAFVMRIPQQQTIAASALAAIIVFSGLLFRSYGRGKTNFRK